MYQKFLYLLDQLLFPRKCLVCKKEDVSICINCLSKLKQPETRRDLNVYSVFSYKDPLVKKIIHRMKFLNDKTLFGATGLIMSDFLEVIISEHLIQRRLKNIILVPIPMTKKKLRSRGYNQAFELCKAMSYKLNIPIDNNLLIKDKETKTQSQVKTREGRFRNIEGAFSVDKLDLETEKNIVIVDDVITTGATILEARKTLEEKGFKKFILLTLASQTL